MHVVALDLSVKSTGFACWQDGQAKPVSGKWELAPSLEWAGRAFVRLQRNLMDLHRVTPITDIIYEEPANMAVFAKMNSSDVPFALIGLAAHADSFAEAIGCKVRSAHQAKWRRHYLGKLPRGEKSKSLKQYAMDRCRQLGLEPAGHDEAEAIGLLTYYMNLCRVTAPWEANEILRPPLAAVA